MTPRTLPLVCDAAAALSVADLAYVASVVDNIALIGERNVNGALLPRVAVSTGNLGLLKDLGRLTGVGITSVTRSYGRAPCAEHCTERHQHIDSVTGRWILTGAKATVLLAAVRPYLRLRADEATSVIALGLTSGFKPATVTKMAALGWPIPDQMRRTA